MSSRTLFAWVLLILIVGVSLFFGYHIVYAATAPTQYNGFQEVNSVVPKNSIYQNPVITKEDDSDFVHSAEPLDFPNESVKQMPPVVGQSEDDLRATRQVSETPPSIEYPEPEAKDPMEVVVNSESEFGDNLRHPEQTIEIQPPMGTVRIAAEGIGSDEHPSLGAHESVQYAPEMAQNGGEFMSGIFAFDGTDVGGIGYSMI